MDYVLELVGESGLDLGSLPAFFRASRMIHSSCPLVLRNSSALHFSRAFIMLSSKRSTNGFLDAIGAGFNFNKILNGFPCLFRILGSQKEFFVFRFN